MQVLCQSGKSLLAVGVRRLWSGRGEGRLVLAVAGVPMAALALLFWGGVLLLIGGVVVLQSR